MSVPGYWLYETSGVLAAIVQRFLAGEQLQPIDIPTMRAYLRQWIAGDFRGPDIEALRASVDEIRTHDDVRAWLDRALDAGIDPL